MIIFFPKGKAPLLSVEAIHQLHIFIFVLALTHVVLSLTTVVLGITQVHISFYANFQNLNVTILHLLSFLFQNKGIRNKQQQCSKNYFCWKTDERLEKMGGQNTTRGWHWFVPFIIFYHFGFREDHSICSLCILKAHCALSNCTAKYYNLSDQAQNRLPNLKIKWYNLNQTADITLKEKEVSPCIPGISKCILVKIILK